MTRTPARTRATWIVVAGVASLGLVGAAVVGLGVGDDGAVTSATGTPATADGPGESTTGVGDGTDLRPLTTAEVREDGRVLEGVHVEGDLLLSGDDLTLRDVRVEGQVIVRGAGTTIEDSELGALAVSGGTGFVGRRLEIFGALGRDGIHVTSDTGRASDVLIEASWVHSPDVSGDSHYDAVQVRGVDGLVIRGSTLDLGPFEVGHSTAVFLEDANGGNRGVLIEGNWINGGGYVLQLAGQDVRVVDNLFGRTYEFGLLYPGSAEVEQEGNRWADTLEALTLE